ncbi:MAG: hypothetical protein CL613_01995 [Aquimarina sp.]|nr:hypothetical protein [Aquimarina sp.]
MVDIDIHKILKGKSGNFNLNIKLHIEKGKIIGIYGASGEGKTSLAKMLCGILMPDQGKIIVADQVWYDSEKKINLKPQKRSANLMFQDYALFPNMSVRKNLEFALQKNGDSKIIEDIISIIELENLQHSKIHKLSGGQQQRVALARAMVNMPRLLILDEPLSAIDEEMRIKLQDYILKTHKAYHLTTILISHNISELHKIADSVYELENGSLHQVKAKSNSDNNTSVSGKVVKKTLKPPFVEITIIYGNTHLNFTTRAEKAANINEGQIVTIPEDMLNTDFK